jgi:hypothetical protein
LPRAFRSRASPVKDLEKSTGELEKSTRNLEEATGENNAKYSGRMRLGERLFRSRAMTLASCPAGSKPWGGGVLGPHARQRARRAGEPRGVALIVGGSAGEAFPSSRRGRSRVACGPSRTVP